MREITKDIQEGWCGPMSFDYDLTPSSEEAKLSRHFVNGSGPQTNGILTRSSSFSSLSSDASDRSSTTAPLSPQATVTTPTHSRNVSVTAATITPTTSVSSNALNPAIFNADDSAAPASSQFHHEAQSTLLHRFSTSASPSDIQVELMGLRFATNANESQVRRAVATSIARHLSSSSPSSLTTTVSASSPSTNTQPPSLSDHITSFLTKYRSLIRRDTAGYPAFYYRGADPNPRPKPKSNSYAPSNAPSTPTPCPRGARITDAAIATAASLVTALWPASEADLVSLASRILLFTCKELYDMEIFGEESFLGWWGDEDGDENEDQDGDDNDMNQHEEGGDGESPRSARHASANAEKEKEKETAIREQTKQFIHWLREAESESEEEEDDEDE